MKSINPISWVCPITNLTATSSGYTYTRGAKRFPSAPGSMEWADNDISASSAGRTEDGVMHKELITNAVKANLSWNYRSVEEVQNVLKAFDGEYFEVCLYDPRYGKAANDYMVRYVMYKGDRSASFYNASMGLFEKCAFNIIDTCIKPTLFTTSHTGGGEVVFARNEGSTTVPTTYYDLNDIGIVTISNVPSGSTVNYYEGGQQRNDLVVHTSGSVYAVKLHAVTGDALVSVS